LPYELIPVIDLFVCVRRQTGTDNEAESLATTLQTLLQVMTFALHDGNAITGPADVLRGPKMETIILLSSDEEDDDDAY
jgi:hypothetical protein